MDRDSNDNIDERDASPGAERGEDLKGEQRAAADEPPEDRALFTISAMRLHLPRPLPPTPGKEPGIRRRLRQIRRLARSILDRARRRD